MQHGKGAGEPLLIALEKSDLETAKKIETQMEQLRFGERGLSLRPMFYDRGSLVLKSGLADKAIEDFKAAVSC